MGVCVCVRERERERERVLKLGVESKVKMLVCAIERERNSK